MPGKHNVLNATAASVLSIEEGIPVINISSALRKFSGINRRMQYLGNLNNTPVIDDYGHHPTEIKNTIMTLRESFPDYKLTMVFQPHRYSRTKDLFKEFVEVMQCTDKLIILEIYSAGESPLKGITSTSLLKAIQNKGLENSQLAESNEDVLEIINSNITEDKEILLIQGAGNISEVSKGIKKLTQFKNFG